MLKQIAAIALLVVGAGSVRAQGAPAEPETLFTNVRVFDGKSSGLSGPTTVLVRGNRIAAIGGGAAAAPGATVIDGAGRTLMPGLIDAHVHIMFGSVSQMAAVAGDIGFLNFAAGKAARDMLMRGYTSVRDLGGPALGLKQAIDAGLAVGPRIWPSGAMISQTGGHGDFRMPTELPDEHGRMTYAERVGAVAIADDPATVTKRAREQLALGATQIKMMAGGGVTSSFDPLDVTQYTPEELRAGVAAAENWGTYVTVHAYTPRAVQQAIAAGVKVIDHGQMLDDATAKMMADKGIWWSMQPFTDDKPSPFAEGSANRIKQLTMFNGTDSAYRLAKKYKVKTAWGTDVLFSAGNLAAQSEMLTKMVQWYTPAETLRMATRDNAELLALSGPRNPYPGKLGVVEPDALADLLLVEGDPIANLRLIENAQDNLKVIMKDGKIYKNSL
jgi:imidazolonepropionase-like amidohydrolase